MTPSTPKNAETGEGWAFEEVHTVADKANDATTELVDAINEEDLEEAKNALATAKRHLEEVEKLLGEFPVFTNGEEDED